MRPKKEYVKESSYKRGLASLVAQMVKNPPAVWETWVWSLGWEDPLEEGMATRSGILVWRIPVDRGPWWAMVHEVAESEMTEWLSTHTCTNSQEFLTIPLWFKIYFIVPNLSSTECQYHCADFSDHKINWTKQFSGKPYYWNSISDWTSSFKDKVPQS